MNNILLTRIDNRLVHGQVGVVWTKTIGSNLIVVVDDQVAKDQLQQQLMRTIAQQSRVGIRFFSIQKTIDVIENASPKQKIFLVCRNPDTVLKILEGGIKLGSINIGNMHFSKGKKQISSKVYVDEHDIKTLNTIENFDNIDLFIQDVPGDSKIKFSDAIKKLNTTID